MHYRVLRDLSDGTVRYSPSGSCGSHVKPPETGEKGIRPQGYLIAPCQYLKQIYWEDFLLCPIVTRTRDGGFKLKKVDLTCIDGSKSCLW